MDRSNHNMKTLFLQLGLDGDDQQINDFVARHGPIEPATKIPDAPFWTASQAQFLREALDSDGDWAELVDELDALLR